jgi:hypothetical protein
LFAIKIYDHPDAEIAQHLLAFATLVDFPQFPDIYHLIPRVLDLRPARMMEHGYLQMIQIEDSDEWETYVKYRKIVSQFLTDQTRSLINGPPIFHGHRYGSPVSLYVGRDRYVGLAMYLLHFLLKDLR